MYRLVFILIGCLLIIACTPSKELSESPESLYPISETIDEIVEKIPNYSSTLVSVKGRGRALVSEPGNSDRVTVSFEADTIFSLFEFKNRIGIEGGKMLVDPDSILIYNKIDKQAEKMSINNGRMTNLNELASINLLDLLNFKIEASDVEQMLQSDTEYVLGFNNKGIAQINKKTGTVNLVEQSVLSGLPYSSIRYENYTELKGYTLPGKITIFSTDKRSKVVFQIRSLEVNPGDLELALDIPENISIIRL